ncbi:MAG: phage head-tail joining protein [Bryobacteraceae bacterium]
MYTEAQLQALRDALAGGVRRVRFGDREIEYRSIEELKAAIAAAEAELAKASGTPVIRQIRIWAEKGF